MIVSGGVVSTGAGNACVTFDGHALLTFGWEEGRVCTPHALENYPVSTQWKIQRFFFPLHRQHDTANTLPFHDTAGAYTYDLMQEHSPSTAPSFLTGRYAPLRDLPPFQPVGERPLPPLNLKHTYISLVIIF
jgi:hypothetical protein